MSKERSKDKGGTLAGQGKQANNHRSFNGKVKKSNGTTNREHEDFQASNNME